MTENNVNLAEIFQAVTQTLAQNQQALNQADEYNQDHGTNMVQTFQTITNALEAKQGSPDSTALAYAAKQLAKKTTSSSGQLYAQGLNQAAEQFKGQQVDSRSALQLLQTLIGGGQAQPQQSAGGDLLGSLLGGMTGGSQEQPQQSAGGDLLGSLLGGMTGGSQEQPQQSAGGDLLGSLLGGMTGGSQAQQQQSAGGDLLGSLLGGMTGGGQAQAQPASGGLSDGLDMGDLLTAGMAYLQAKQAGSDNTQALIQAFLAGSGMGGSVHRTQSTQMVVSAFLQALSGMGKK